MQVSGGSSLGMSRMDRYATMGAGKNVVMVTFSSSARQAQTKKRGIAIAMVIPLICAKVTGIVLII